MNHIISFPSPVTILIKIKSVTNPFLQEVDFGADILIYERIHQIE